MLVVSDMLSLRACSFFAWGRGHEEEILLCLSTSLCAYPGHEFTKFTVTQHVRQSSPTPLYILKSTTLWYLMQQNTKLKSIFSDFLLYFYVGFITIKIT
jgi:hypothetical protein